MFYINLEPNESGNHGNPQSNNHEGAVALPDELLGEYIDSMGFVDLTVKDGTVTKVTRNEAAYQKWQDEHPVQPEPAPEPTEQDRLEAQVMYTALMTDTLLDEEE